MFFTIVASCPIVSFNLLCRLFFKRTM